MSKANLLKKYDFIFFSPHLDDAILSIGGFIQSQIQKKKKILVVTVFTKGEDPFNQSIDQKDFLGKSSSRNHQELFLKRQNEDLKVAKLLGFDVEHLGYTDALFRQKNKKLLYPKYSILFSGKERDDKKFKQDIQKTIKNIVQKKSHKKSKIFGPFGVGSHIDHLLVFSCIQALSLPSTFFWEDVPYKNHPQKLEKRVSELKKFPKIFFHVCASEEEKKKKKACKFYKTQISSLKLHGLGDIDYKKEVFFTV